MSNPGFIVENKQVIGFGAWVFRVQQIDRAEANALIRQNHYSKKVCITSFIHMGIYRGPELLGVLQFGPAMNPASYASVVAGTQKDEYLELNRMWLHDDLPRNSESRALSYAITFIKRRFPRIAWIQSFADERCGRYGVTYQAANFLFCGEHRACFWLLDGETYHNSLMTRRRDLSPKQAKLQANRHRCQKLEFRQFRYIYFIKKRFQGGPRHKVRPFPKHAPEVSMETRLPARQERRGRFPHGAPLSVKPET